MSAYIYLSATPLPRKSNLLETRMRTALGVMAQKGATATRCWRVVMGDNAGNFGMGAKFEDFEAAMCAFDEAMQDPIFQDLSKQRWDDPAGKGVGPFMMRDLYETIDLSTAVHIVRTYQISRNNIEKAIEIMKEIGKLSPSNTLSAVVPVMSPQMDQISAIYHFDSMGSAGKYMDEISMKSEFQELLKQASNLGTLIRAGFNIRM